METGQMKKCGRCENDILCKAEAIDSCACSTIQLSESTLDHLKETQYDCLCNACLIDINKRVKEADSTTNVLTEDIHYYMEDGLLVFKELYHIQRGYCCKSGCRHCAYGYKKSY